jgi:hypothetical protein
MRRLKIALGLVVGVGLMTVAAVPTMAAVPRWVECVRAGSTFSNADCTSTVGAKEWGTKELEGTSEVTSSGTLTLADIGAPGGAVEVACKGRDLGWVTNLKNPAEAGEDGTFAITSIGCEFVPGKNGACGATAGVKANPVHLPWGTKLTEKNGEVRDEVVAGTGGNPGWNVECLVDGVFQVFDVCEAERHNTTAVRANRAALTVESIFDKTTEEEEHAQCSLSKEHTGIVRGTIAFKLRSGNRLWVLPEKITTALRWVDCAKVGEGEGHFGSGSCTTAGSGWETKELIGTSEVTSSGELTLEDNEPAVGGPVAINCKGKGSGWVTNLEKKSEPGESGISEIAVSHCEFVPEKHGECEESGPVEIGPVHLPWSTRIVEREKEARDEIVAGTGGRPGWDIECDVEGIFKISDVCEAEVHNTMSLRANRASLTMETVFDEKTKAEQMAKCSSGKKNSGLVRGTIAFKLRNGNGLWTLPASNQKIATTARWVECVKAEESEGHFGSGDCTTAGNGWETKELEGTSEVTSSYEITLEDTEPIVGGPIALSCKGPASGWVANPENEKESGEGAISRMQLTDCGFEKSGDCKEASEILGGTVEFPWGTKLAERGKEVRDEIVGGTPAYAGWDLECVGRLSDACEFRSHITMDTIANRTNLTVEAGFDERTKEEQMARCSTGKNSGLVRGTIAFKLGNGNSLWILAPNLGT